MWQAPTYYSEVAKLLPAEKMEFEVTHPKQGKIIVSAIDWYMPELELFDREFNTLLQEDLLTIVSPVAIQPPAQSFIMKKRLLNVAPWNNNAVFWCDSCRIWRPAFTLVDVAGFPTDLTDDRKWACDGCRTRWFRKGKTADGSPITKRKWAELMRSNQGAPQAWVDEISARPDADRTHFSI